MAPKVLLFTWAVDTLIRPSPIKSPNQLGQEWELVESGVALLEESINGHRKTARKEDDEDAEEAASVAAMPSQINCDIGRRSLLKSPAPPMLVSMDSVIGLYYSVY